MFDIFQIIKQVKKHIGRKEILLISALIIIYFFTRLINLDGLPIFGDEGIYIRWAKVARADASWRFISLTDGKQPLQTWGTIPFLKLVESPLIAGRLFSVATGLFALIGMFLTCFYLFGKRAAFIGATLYIVTPYFIFYDRMALVDSAVNSFAMWIFLFSILLVRNMRLDIALLFGLLSGMAVLAKSSVRIFLGLGYFAIVLLESRKELVKKLTNYSVLYLLVGFMAIVIYNIQRLSPFFHYVAEKNKTFIVTFDEFIKSPFVNVLDNIKSIPYYVLAEMGYVIGLLGLLGLLLIFKKERRLAIYIAMWIFIPFIIISFVSKVIFPRYLIFFASFLVMCAAYFFLQLKSKTTLIVIGVLVVISVAFFDYTILFDQKNIPFPKIDRGQYVEGITAGWGISDLITYVRVKSKEKRVILMAEGDFGVIGDQLDAHLTQNDNIFIKGYWPLNKEHVVEMQKELKENYVYVVFSHKQEFPVDWPIKLVNKYPKPYSDSAIYFAEVAR